MEEFDKVFITTDEAGNTSPAEAISQAWIVSERERLASEENRNYLEDPTLSVRAKYVK